MMRRIGEFIRLVDVRNKDLEVDKLLGLTVDKRFIPSVANTVGSNMANYKIIRKGQFACSLMQVRRDKKMPVALLADLDEAIISQAYPVFEIINTEELLPEYMMMWMSRSEFDREACFYAVGGVRGSLEWEDFCNMELPVPDIGKQREIVKEYRTIVDRIALNEKLNQKLEETAQAIYKQWFVDCEFPISAEQAAALGKPELEGQPYKSSGGEMVWNDELEQDIPTGWEFDSLKSFGLDVSDGNYSAKYPKSNEFLDAGIPFIRGTDFNEYFISPFDLRYISDEKHRELLKGHTQKGDVLITTRGASIGKYAYVSENFIDVNINSQLVRLNGGVKYSQYYLGLMVSSEAFKKELQGAITGSAQPQLSVTNLMAMKLLKPSVKVIQNFCESFQVIRAYDQLKFDESKTLQYLIRLIFSKMTKAGA